MKFGLRAVGQTDNRKGRGEGLKCTEEPPQEPIFIFKLEFRAIKLIYKWQDPPLRLLTT